MLIMDHGKDEKNIFLVEKTKNRTQKKTQKKSIINEHFFSGKTKEFAALAKKKKLLLYEELSLEFSIS